MCERAGNASTVGSVGAMMGGGVGFLARWIGLSIDSLLSASIVLATGELVVATREGEHSDLFWAIRGGGSNFGVIVDFTLTAIRLGWDDSNGPGRLLAGVRLVRHSNGGATCFGNGIGRLCSRADKHFLSCSGLVQIQPDVLVLRHRSRGLLLPLARLCGS